MKYVIVANGPFLAAPLMQAVTRHACVIALDGAANQLARLHLIPDLILGDFDSFQEEEVLTPILKIQLLDQDLTDFQKAIHFAMYDAPSHGFKLATEIHIVCATGGRFDHDQANIRTLKAAYNPACPMYLHNESQTLTFARNETIHIQGKHHDHCGIFGMPEAIMIVKNGGLEYGSTTPYPLTLTQFSTSNRLIGDVGAIVEIQGEALIAHPSFFYRQNSFERI